MRERIVSTLRGLLIVAVTAAFGQWAVRALVARTQRSVAELGAVAELPRATPTWGWGVVAALTLLVAAALVRRPGLTRAAPHVALAAVAAVAVTLALPLGHFVLLTGLAVVVALSVGVLWREPRGAAEAPRTDVVIGGALWLGIAAVMATFAIHRYHAFGAGSWDLGCMIHNFYRASRLLDTRSTVLGDVDFLGDHFMVGIWVYAPLMWLSSSGAMYLVIQSASLAASAPVVFAMARRRGAPREVALSLALATGLSFGMQSAAYFDGHEIAVGFGFLAWGLWAFEAGRWRLATGLLMLFATFKESLGAYVVGLGLLAIWRGLRGDDRRGLRWGTAWIVLGGVWFVLVNRVFMPALRARGNAPEPHETFGDFGPTVFTAVLGIASDPVRALAAVFVPDEKLHAQLVTLSGLGWLPFGGPEVWLAALPLVAERFLSSKSTMWEMGYHYAAPLSLYAGWASVVAWPRVDAGLRALLARAGAAAATPRVLAVYVVVLAGLVNALGYRHPANFHRWNESYFSTPERQADHRGAVALLESEGRDARLAVQNRILPHLADRPVIYRLGEWAKADWVLLSIGESAWPYDDGLPARLARDLLRDPGWRLVYARGSTLVFARVSVTARAAVPVPEHLGLNR